MSRSSAAKRRLARLDPSGARPGEAGGSWVADDGAHELASEVEAELELDDCAPTSDASSAPFADERYSALSAEQQEILRAELQDRLGAYLGRGRARVVVTDNVRTMMSVKRGHGVYTFRLHHMFVDAPPAILRSVVAYAEQQDSAASEQLRAFIDANDDAIRQRSAARPLAVDVEGRFANLQEVFDDLNTDYFGGAIKARITWGPRTRRKRKRASIKLGSYTVEDELIRVHPVLDAAWVPEYFVAYIVYHEMLHQVVPPASGGTRRAFHSREFRLRERAFHAYADAHAWEQRNLRRILQA